MFERQRNVLWSTYHLDSISSSSHKSTAFAEILHRGNVSIPTAAKTRWNSQHHTICKVLKIPHGLLNDALRKVGRANLVLTTHDSIVLQEFASVFALLAEATTGAQAEKSASISPLVAPSISSIYSDLEREQTSCKYLASLCRTLRRTFWKIRLFERRPLLNRSSHRWPVQTELDTSIRSLRSCERAYRQYDQVTCAKSSGTTTRIGEPHLGIKRRNNDWQSRCWRRIDEQPPKFQAQTFILRLWKHRSTCLLLAKNNDCMHDQSSNHSVAFNSFQRTSLHFMCGAGLLFWRQTVWVIKNHCWETTERHRWIMVVLRTRMNKFLPTRKINLFSEADADTSKTINRYISDFLIGVNVSVAPNRLNTPRNQTIPGIRAMKINRPSAFLI